MSARQELTFSEPAQASYDQSFSDWAASVPWYRRFSARLGLQGKLMLCFMALLSAGLGTSCWMFASRSSTQMSEVMGEQARQLSCALALSSERAVTSNDVIELRRLAQDLIKSRNILYVGFLDEQSRSLVLASRDLEFGPDQLTAAKDSTQSLLQVRQRNSALFGRYLEVVAPILSTPQFKVPATPADLLEPASIEAFGSGRRLLGFVAVGVSQEHEMAQLHRVNLMIAGIGYVMMMISVPLGYMLVHRVFLPIRELVAATRRISSGDLDAFVAIHRPDDIGLLARSFNEMVIRVKRQQQALAAANKDLEEKVTQRTAQLEAANKRLSSEIAEKEDFLRAVSHDLNAPLRNISGMATMLLMKYREKLEDDVVHRLERIQKNVEVETDLITELLELSRIKTRRQKMELVEIDVLVRELLEMFDNDLKSRGISLLVDGQLPVLECERARLRQVFQNLIDNAIKYMDDSPHKRKEIHVGCFVRPTEAEFYVRDTGSGIEPDDLDKVFFVFRRGKGTQVQNVAGKGVGLASVKSIIETYSGSIWVESKLGEGSTFHFTINGRFVPASQTRTLTSDPSTAAQSGAEEGI